MRKIAIVLAALLLATACRDKGPQPGNDDLAGLWECISGCEADLLEFNIADEGQVFFIFTGQRMYRSGTWELGKNRLIMDFDDEERMTYPVTLKNDTLVLGDNEMVFTVFIPTEDPCDLSAFFASMDDISFSPPMLEDFPWNVSGDSGIEEVTVGGQVLYTIIRLEGDFTAIGRSTGAIASRLKNMGYDSDPLMASEIASGYRKGTCVVLFRPELDDETDSESEIALNIYFGKLPL